MIFSSSSFSGRQTSLLDKKTNGKILFAGLWVVLQRDSRSASESEGLAELETRLSSVKLKQGRVSIIRDRISIKMVIKLSPTARYEILAADGSNKCARLIEWKYKKLRENCEHGLKEATSLYSCRIVDRVKVKSPLFHFPVKPSRHGPSAAKI